MAGLLLEQRIATKRIERLLPLSFPKQWRKENPNLLKAFLVGHFSSNSVHDISYIKKLYTDFVMLQTH
jgi:hypothetical protein